MRKILSIFIIGIFFLLPLQPQTVDASASVDQVRTFVEQTYVGKLNGSLSSAQTIDELMNMLDVYSDYYSYDEYTALTNSIEQKTYGLGIQYEYKKGLGIYIVTVYEDSSAYSVGLRAGDVIIEVNGSSVISIDESTIPKLLLGAEGTYVTLAIKTTDGTIVNKTVQRKGFTVPIVTGKLLYGNTGYISVSSFAFNTALDVKSKAMQLVNQGATSFILDFQNNGGGYVQTARQFISMFPNTVYAYLEITKSLSKIISPVYVNYKLPGTSRVLINRNSASASEMLAASLKDQKAAILYGERSYGKGIIQSFYSVFEDGSIRPDIYSGTDILKLTTNEFRGPSGTVIHDVGVTPNVVTATPIEDAHLDAIKDTYATYQSVKEFKDVPADKIFTIQFNKRIEANIPSETIELVSLGGETIKTAITIEDQSITVQPKQPLVLGEKYVILIHPSIKGSNGKALKTGYYASISVKK